MRVTFGHLDGDRQFWAALAHSVVRIRTDDGDERDYEVGAGAVEVDRETGALLVPVRLWIGIASDGRSAGPELTIPIKDETTVYIY